jgi:signal transduction histidine kinase
VSLVRVDLKAMIEERVALLGSAHPALEYRLEFAPVDLLATADPDLVKGILTNLLENAAEAAGQGEARGVVLIRAGVLSAVEENGNGASRLHVEIHDTGSGLSEQARSTLFEPSISFKKGGMGLGLSIARRSALLCGGDLEVCEGELGGAGFRLLLPAAVADSGPLRAGGGQHDAEPEGKAYPDGVSGARRAG